MNLIRRTLVPAAGVALLVAVAAPTANAADSPPDPVPAVGMLVNVFSGKCLEIADSSTDDGAPAQQWDCDGGENQLWNFDSGIPGAIVNVHSGKCLEVADLGREMGDPIGQWDCDGGGNQVWNFAHDSPTEGWEVLNRPSGWALEIPGWSWDNGTQADLWSWTTDSKQQWKVVTP